MCAEDIMKHKTLNMLGVPRSDLRSAFIIRMNVKNPHYDITEWHLSKSLVDLKPLGISMFVILSN